MLFYVPVSCMTRLGQGHMLVRPSDITNHSPLSENFFCFARWCCWAEVFPRYKCFKNLTWELGISVRKTVFGET